MPPGPKGSGRRPFVAYCRGLFDEFEHAEQIAMQMDRTLAAATRGYGEDDDILDQLAQRLASSQASVGKRQVLS